MLNLKTQSVRIFGRVKETNSIKLIRNQIPLDLLFEIKTYQINFSVTVTAPIFFGTVLVSL